jgi:hypothetical protein
VKSWRPVVGDVVNTPEGVGLLEAIHPNRATEMRYAVGFRDTPDRLWWYARTELTLVAGGAA